MKAVFNNQVCEMQKFPNKIGRKKEQNNKTKRKQYS